MSAVCFEYDDRGWDRDMWLYLIAAFGIEAYERGRPVDLPGNHYGVVAIDSLDDLPDVPLYLVQPKTGKHLNGETSIDDFVYPDNAVYYFGADKGDVTEESFEPDPVPASLYIPMVDDDPSLEIFSHQAGIIIVNKLRELGKI